MRMVKPWKHPDSGIYYFRRAVPKSLQNKIGKSMIKVSLGTKDSNDAKRLFAMELNNCEELFDSAKKGINITKAKAKEIAGRWLKRKLDRDIEDRESFDVELVYDNNPDTMDLHSYYDEHIDLIAESYKSGNIYDAIKEDINEVARFENINIQNTSEFQNLIDAIFWAKIDYYRVLNKRADNDWSTNIPELLSKYPSPKSEVLKGSSSSITLQNLFDKYKKEKQLPEKTINEYQKAISRFTGVFGNVSAENINGSMAREFKDLLIKTPKSLTREQQQLSLKKLVNIIDGNVEQTLSDSTINKQLGSLSTLLQWSYNNSYLNDNWSNPFKGKTVKRKGFNVDRQPFSNADLQVIFSSDVYTKGFRPKGGSGEAAYWIPLIALYTGMRLEESGQLLASDIRQIDNIWCFDVNDSDGKQTKNKSSNRLIPIHNDLLSLGFVNYANGIGNGNIFPLLKSNKYGKLTQNWSKWFNRYLKKIGIDDKSKVHHSFRHCMKDALRDAEVEESISDAITGHTSNSVGRSYGKGYSVTVLNNAIQKITYDIEALKSIHTS